MAKATKIVTEVETEVVEILTKVEHDGEELLAGAKAEMSKLAAKALYAVGAARPAKTEPQKGAE